jgi:hypothetical protein
MNFGNHSITKETYDLIVSILPEGKTILELGSGFGTGALSKHYKMYSIEHDMRFINMYNSRYIHAPLIDDSKQTGWYDIESIKDSLPTEYDLLLVDGPPTDERRKNFIHKMHYFNSNVIWVFDDLHRPDDLETYLTVCKLRNKEPEIIDCGQKKVGLIR